MATQETENPISNNRNATNDKFKNSVCYVWLSQKTTFWAMLIFVMLCAFGLVSVILGGIVDGMVDNEELSTTVPCIVMEHKVNCTNECVNNNLDIVPANYSLAGCRTFCRSKVKLTLENTSFNSTVTNLRQIRRTEPYASSSLFFTTLTVNSTTKCYINAYSIGDETAKTSFAYVYGPRLVMKTVSIVFGCVAVGCLIYMAIYVTFETQNCWKYYKERKKQQAEGI
ncbi:predicted protein [Naegleria gruberi]|uniref:Predicted protein n=1 Tax=Naegleria gruberi TaxID=5762 RepID=D2VLH6_NAEGR|nr:uncharacterized protein NAEGRDRAFT_69782 [Naegleria gruberi]EFC42386.1 predicted protein [Naegleria gruberi]|eukprot:XP_002675130.1 predicted protein [Naegleria gruberi strain NEG-M]